MALSSTHPSLPPTHAPTFYLPKRAVSSLRSIATTRTQFRAFWRRLRSTRKHECQVRLPKSNMRSLFVVCLAATGRWVHGMPADTSQQQPESLELVATETMERLVKLGMVTSQNETGLVGLTSPDQNEYIQSVVGYYKSFFTAYNAVNAIYVKALSSSVPSEGSREGSQIVAETSGVKNDVVQEGKPEEITTHMAAAAFRQSRIAKETELKALCQNLILDKALIQVLDFVNTKYERPTVEDVCRDPELLREDFDIQAQTASFIKQIGQNATQDDLRKAISERMHFTNEAYKTWRNVAKYYGDLLKGLDTSQSNQSPRILWQE